MTTMPHAWAPSTVTAGPDASSDGDPATAGGGISRVNAFDGLFLRAEHLELMQDYARELATAVGASGGTGTVWGYDLSVRGNLLHVEPGLAVDPDGQPLRASEAMTLDLTGLDLGSDGYALVTVARFTWPYGTEPVQGVLCEDPCSGGGTGRPYRAEGVQARLVPVLDTQLVGVQAERRRSWLAARLFANERNAADAWPAKAGPSLFDRVWSPPPVPVGATDGVPLGVLVPGDGAWILDTWGVRRDREPTPPTSWWQWQTGMRPWNVFMAQVRKG
jgi:hypothetical protein